MRVMFYFFHFSTYIRFFVKILMKTNVNISKELNFFDVHQCVNCIGLLIEKFTRTPVHSLCT